MEEQLTWLSSHGAKVTHDKDDDLISWHLYWRREEGSVKEFVEEPGLKLRQAIKNEQDTQKKIAELRPWLAKLKTTYRKDIQGKSDDVEYNPQELRRELQEKLRDPRQSHVTQGHLKVCDHTD